MLEKIVESCQFLLNNYPGAQASKSYLDSRLNKESQKTFGFGYFPGVQDLAVLADLVGEDVLHEEGLFYTKSIEDSLSPRKIPTCYFQNYPIVMPFRDPYGKVVGLVGRTLLPDAVWKSQGIKSKYKNTGFKKGNFAFGLYENKKSIMAKDYVYVVEGQFDVIKAVEIGFRNIVAVGGSNLSLYQFSVISRYTSNIRLLLDNDEAGEKGRKRITSKFGNFANIQNFYLPNEYKDIDECITKGQISDYTEVPFFIKG